MVKGLAKLQRVVQDFWESIDLPSLQVSLGALATPCTAGQASSRQRKEDGASLPVVHVKDSVEAW